MPALSAKLSVEVHDLVADAEIAAAYGVDKIPAVAIVRGGEEPKDYGIRLYGIPSGYEFGTLIEDINMVSKGDPGLSAKTLGRAGEAAWADRDSGLCHPHLPPLPACRTAGAQAGHGQR